MRVGLKTLGTGHESQAVAFPFGECVEGAFSADPNHISFSLRPLTNMSRKTRDIVLLQKYRKNMERNEKVDAGP